MCTHSCFGLFIGYATFVIYAILLITSIGFLADKNILNDVIKEMKVNDADINVEVTTIGIRFAIVVVLIVGVIMLIVSGFLIKGINKRQPMYMIPWILITFIHIVGSFIYNFVILLTSMSPAIEFIIGMSLVVLQIAIFYPIYTLYKQMRKETFIAAPQTV
ncbi:uncharacterized protein LOC142239296 [Haematobia irritans]|uniref:uncharacterized protein LOC142239296 n=1 Tax=Haematobia irritans TaxID=7368 RepID=UPI003F508DCA